MATKKTKLISLRTGDRISMYDPEQELHLTGTVYSTLTDVDTGSTSIVVTIKDDNADLVAMLDPELYAPVPAHKHAYLYPTARPERKRDYMPMVTAGVYVLAVVSITVAIIALAY